MHDLLDFGSAKAVSVAKKTLLIEKLFHCLCDMLREAIHASFITTEIYRYLLSYFLFALACNLWRSRRGIRIYRETSLDVSLDVYEPIGEKLDD